MSQSKKMKRPIPRYNEPVYPKIEYDEELVQDYLIQVRSGKQDQIIQFLTEHKLPADAQHPENGDSAYHVILGGLPELSEEEKMGLIKTIHSYGPNVNLRNGKGVTPLHLAAREQYGEIMDFLLEKKARVDVVDHLGLSPLHYLITGKSATCVPPKGQQTPLVRGKPSPFPKNQAKLGDSAIESLQQALAQHFNQKDSAFHKYFLHLQNTLRRAEKMFPEERRKMKENFEQEMATILASRKPASERDALIQAQRATIITKLEKLLSDRLQPTFQELDFTVGEDKPSWSAGGQPIMAEDEDPVKIIQQLNEAVEHGKHAVTPFQERMMDLTKLAKTLGKKENDCHIAITDLVNLEVHYRELFGADETDYEIRHLNAMPNSHADDELSAFLRDDEEDRPIIDPSLLYGWQEWYPECGTREGVKNNDSDTARRIIPNTWTTLGVQHGDFIQHMPIASGTQAKELVASKARSYLLRTTNSTNGEVKFNLGNLSGKNQAEIDARVATLAQGFTPYRPLLPHFNRETISHSNTVVGGVCNGEKSFNHQNFVKGKKVHTFLSRMFFYSRMTQHHLSSLDQLLEQLSKQPRDGLAHYEVLEQVYSINLQAWLVLQYLILMTREHNQIRGQIETLKDTADTQHLSLRQEKGKHTVALYVKYPKDKIRANKEIPAGATITDASNLTMGEVELKAQSFIRKTTINGQIGAKIILPKGFRLTRAQLTQFHVDITLLKGTSFDNNPKLGADTKLSTIGKFDAGFAPTGGWNIMTLGGPLTLQPNEVTFNNLDLGTQQIILLESATLDKLGIDQANAKDLVLTHGAKVTAEQDLSANPEAIQIVPIDNEITPADYQFFTQRIVEKAETIQKSTMEMVSQGDEVLKMLNKVIATVNNYLEKYLLGNSAVRQWGALQGATLTDTKLGYTEVYDSTLPKLPSMPRKWSDLLSEYQADHPAFNEADHKKWTQKLISHHLPKMTQPVNYIVDEADPTQVVIPGKTGLGGIVVQDGSFERSLLRSVGISTTTLGLGKEDDSGALTGLPSEIFGKNIQDRTTNYGKRIASDLDAYYPLATDLYHAVFSAFVSADNLVAGKKHESATQINNQSAAVNAEVFAGVYQPILIDWLAQIVYVRQRKLDAQHLKDDLRESISQIRYLFQGYDNTGNKVDGVAIQASGNLDKTYRQALVNQLNTLIDTNPWPPAPNTYTPQTAVVKGAYDDDNKVYSWDEIKTQIYTATAPADNDRYRAFLLEATRLLDQEQRLYRGVVALKKDPKLDIAQGAHASVVPFLGEGFRLIKNKIIAWVLQMMNEDPLKNEANTIDGRLNKYLVYNVGKGQDIYESLKKNLKAVTDYLDPETLAIPGDIQERVKNTMIAQAVDNIVNQFIRKEINEAASETFAKMLDQTYTPVDPMETRIATDQAVILPPSRDPRMTMRLNEVIGQITGNVADRLTQARETIVAGQDLTPAGKANWIRKVYNQDYLREDAQPHCYSLNLDLVNKLLQYQADVNARDLDNKYPLHRAIELQNLEAMEMLLSKGARITDRFARRRRYLDVDSPLEFALRSFQYHNEFLFTDPESKEHIAGFFATFWKPMVRQIRRMVLDNQKKGYEMPAKIELLIPTMLLLYLETLGIQYSEYQNGWTHEDQQKMLELLKKRGVELKKDERDPEKHPLLHQVETRASRKDLVTNSGPGTTILKERGNQNDALQKLEEDIKVLKLRIDSYQEELKSATASRTNRINTILGDLNKQLTSKNIQKTQLRTDRDTLGMYSRKSVKEGYDELLENTNTWKQLNQDPTFLVQEPIGQAQKIYQTLRRDDEGQNNNYMYLHLWEQVIQDPARLRHIRYLPLLLIQVDVEMLKQVENMSGQTNQNEMKEFIDEFKLLSQAHEKIISRTIQDYEELPPFVEDNYHLRQITSIYEHLIQVGLCQTYLYLIVKLVRTHLNRPEYAPNTRTDILKTLIDPKQELSKYVLKKLPGALIKSLMKIFESEYEEDAMSQNNPSVQALMDEVIAIMKRQSSLVYQEGSDLAIGLKQLNDYHIDLFQKVIPMMHSTLHGFQRYLMNDGRHTQMMALMLEYQKERLWG